MIFKRILVPYDGSRESDRASGLALDLANARNGTKLLSFTLLKIFQFHLLSGDILFKH